MKQLCFSLRSAWILAAWLVMASGASAAPIVFNSTESAIPGDVIYLQGDNFATTGTAATYFYVVTGTESSLATPPASAVELTNSTFSNQALTASIPQNIPLGLYAVWVKDSSGDCSPPVFINRARATSFEYSQVSPGYYFRIFGRNLCLNNGATPYVKFVNGGTSLPAVILTSGTIISTSTNDSNVLMVQAPSGTGFTGTNTYTVEVSNGSGTGSGNYDVTTAIPTIQSRSSGSDVFSLGTPWGADFAAIHASIASGTIPSGAINITTATNPHTGQLYSAGSGTNGGYWNNAIQQALYDAGNPAYYPNGATVYIPSGTYPLNWSYETGTTSGTIGGWNGSSWAVSGTFIGPNGKPFDLDNPPNNQTPTGQYELDIPANVVLQGAGIGNTVFDDSSPAFSGYTYFITYAADSGFVNSSNYIGVQGFTYNQTMTVTATSSPPSMRNYAVNSTDIFWDHIQFNGAHLISGTEIAIHPSFDPADSNDTNVLVQSSTFNYVTVGGANAGDYGNNYIFRESTIASWYTYINFPYIGNMIFEDNILTRNADFPPPGFAGLDNGGFQSTGTDKIVLNNTFNAINVTGSNQLYYQGENHGQSITCQSGVLNGYGQYGPGPTDTGTATAATNKTLTDSAKSWTTNEFAAPATEEILAITSGPGAGEWAPIVSNTGTTITISGTWAIIPSGSSPASTFAVENNNGYLMGTVTSAGTTTLTDSTQDWPTNFYAGESVAVIGGPGMGQIATIIGNSSTTLTFSPAWTEPPTSESHYAINGALQYGAQRWLIKGNTLQSVLRGVLMYLGGYDCAVVGNKLSSSGGILFDAWQRSIISTGSTYDRFDIAWKNVITDNVVTDPDNNEAAYLATQANTTTSSPLFGTLALGIENRRNVLEGSNPNLVDGAYGPHESFVNLTGQQTSGDDASGTSILDTVYMDNVSISCTNAYEVNTAVAQTPIQDSLMFNCTTAISDTMLPGGTTSTQTVTGTTADYLIFDANFSGTGTSIGTGGTGDNMVDVGATGKLVQGNYSNEISIDDATPFDSESGSYLHTVFTGTGNNCEIQFTPVSPRYSWSRIFDQRSGQWVVNGAFDFFYRPGQTNTNAAQFRPLDLAGGTYTGTGSGLRMIINSASLTKLYLQFVSGSNGGGNLLMTGTIPAFQADTVYHIGVTFSTDVTTGTTTGTNGAGANGTTPYNTVVKMYFQGGTTGEMAETGSTLIATGTLTLNHNVVNDTNPVDWFNGGPWTFNGYNVSGLPTTNDYDGFRIFYNDPGTFPGLDDTNY